MSVQQNLIITYLNENELQWNHCVSHNIDGLAQDCSNCSVLTMELLQSYTKPSINLVVDQLQISWYGGILRDFEMMAGEIRERWASWFQSWIIFIPQIELNYFWYHFFVWTDGIQPLFKHTHTYIFCVLNWAIDIQITRPSNETPSGIKVEATFRWKKGG